MRPAERRGGARLALALAGLCACACRPAEGSPRQPEATLPALPAVPGAAAPYTGTWVGPELSLSFAGPWVFVRPSADPSSPPIELRVEVERQEGDAFALRTSVAAVLPADFLRPPDWTLLVEAEQLALAMGDEPLAAYRPADPGPPILLGPTMLDELELPDQLSMAEAVACLELANDHCVELEADGPLAAGCRELQWASCAATLGPLAADPTVRAARAASAQIHRQLLTLRYAQALAEACPPALAADGRALLERAQGGARASVARLREAGPLPADPHLPELLARLELSEPRP